MSVNFEKRIFSYLIDMGISVALSLLIHFYVYRSISLFDDFSLFFLTYITSCIIYFIINTVLLKITNGYTIGSAIFQIKTISINQNRIRIRECFLKNCFLSFFPCCLINALYMVVIHTEKTVFDTLSNTIVVPSKTI